MPCLNRLTRLQIKCKGSHFILIIEQFMSETYPISQLLIETMCKTYYV